MNLFGTQISNDERRAVDEIRRRCSFRDDDHVIRVAVQRLADHLGVELPEGAFDVPWHRGMAPLLDKERKRGA